MKTALFTLLNDSFLPGYVAFIKSLKKHHPEFDLDFIILDIGLSYESQETIIQYYDKIIFRKPRLKEYASVNMSRTDPRLQPTYYTLDAFCQTDYDRIIAIDMDVIVLGDISEVLNCDSDFAAVKAYNAKMDILREDINSGVFVVGKKYLNEETYQGLLQIAKRGHSMPDQKTINAYFFGKMDYFNKRFNVEKRMLHTQKYNKILEDIRILHFIALKPREDHGGAGEIENSFGEFEKLWWAEYES